jgi:hypothetical protein
MCGPSPPAPQASFLRTAELISLRHTIQSQPTCIATWIGVTEKQIHIHTMSNGNHRPLPWCYLLMGRYLGFFAHPAAIRHPPLTVEPHGRNPENMFPDKVILRLHSWPGVDKE